MIECECCGGWFHPDEIRECPECGIEVCEECFEAHIQSCTDFDDIDDTNEELLNVPRECPKCGEELELDIDYGTTTVMCPKCDFELDVTDEFSKLKDDDESEFV